MNTQELYQSLLKCNNRKEFDDCFGKLYEDLRLKVLVPYLIKIKRNPLLESSAKDAFQDTMVGIYHKMDKKEQFQNILFYAKKAFKNNQARKIKALNKVNRGSSGNMNQKSGNSDPPIALLEWEDLRQFTIKFLSQFNFASRRLFVYRFMYGMPPRVIKSLCVKSIVNGELKYWGTTEISNRTNYLKRLFMVQYQSHYGPI